MLTVKIVTKSTDGYSLNSTRVISAVATEADYWIVDNEPVHYVAIEDYKGNNYEITLDSNVVIYVENLAGKTVTVYHG